jgi:hypothetical protein
MKLFAYSCTILILLFLGCKNNIQPNQKLYQVINDLIDYKIITTDIVITDINKIQDFSILLKDTSKYGYPEPPQAFVIYYDLDDFVDFFEKGYISKQDIDFMYEQVKASKEIVLDPKKINIKSISIDTFLSVIKNYKYDIDSTYLDFKRNYDCDSLVRFSNPIFSRNGDRVIISIWVYSKFGTNESTFLIKKKGSKWIDSKTIYESKYR